MAGVVLGERYRLEERIGEGATAEVYRATDEVLDRSVAVKILRQQFAADEQFRARFLTEARAAARLAHPNVVAVYDVGVDENTDVPQHYIVMELVEGPSLRDVVAREAPLAPERAFAIAIQVLAALQYAHDHGLVHRDVKPANVLLTRDGQVKVADFGIAAATDTHQPGETGVVVGTAFYISPEQATGKPATASSDLYAVGIMLFEMLTGQLPFTGATPVAVALQHVQAPIPSARAITPRLPQRVDGIIRRALAKDPSERYKRADEFAGVLQSYLRLGLEQTSALPVIGRSGGGGAVAVAARVPKRRRIDWFVVLIGALILLAFVGSVPLAAGIYRIYQSRFARPPAVPTVPVVAAPSPTVAVATPSVVPVSPTPPTPTAPSPTPTKTLVKVPDVVNKPLLEAEQILWESHLTARIIEQEVPATATGGVVLAQQPKAGDEIAEGDVVEITVARLPDLVPVPRVIGLSRALAEESIRDRGLSVQFSEQFSDEPVGTVIDQRPAGGDEVAPQSTVTLVLSRGRQATPTPTVNPNLVVVPSVVGLHENEARQVLEAAGLKLNPVNYQTEDDVADQQYFRSIAVGHVLSQAQRPGNQVPRGTGIDIAVRAR